MNLLQITLVVSVGLIVQVLQTQAGWSCKPGVIDYVWNANETGISLDPEHPQAYWREDLLLNAHHWNWHAVYPVTADPKTHKLDRKGELFYYMHRQLVNRYDVERMSLGMPRVVPMDKWDEKIPEGLAPHLVHGKTGVAYSPRATNTVLTDLPGLITMAEMRTYRSRVDEAISSGKFKYEDGTEGPLDIRLLGNTVEANFDCPNRPYYAGDWGLHNNGHDLLGMVHDPDNRYNSRSTIGVMGDVKTACRDPGFYRWHKFVDDEFEKYEQTRTPFTDKELSFPGMKVKRVRLLDSAGKKTKSLKTMMTKKVVDIEYWPDFNRRDDTKVKFTYPALDHEKFSYQIKVKNFKKTAVKATVRIFIAPKKNSANKVLTMDEYRTLYFEMDTFVQEIKPGVSTFKRKSSESLVTIPYDQMVNSIKPVPEADETKRAYCGCGWPENLLLPRGNAQGMEFSLVVMLTNYEDDKSDSSGGDPLPTCAKSVRYCGLLNNKWPEKHDMGYPFNRRASAKNIEEFVKNKSNIETKYFKIFHKA